MGQAFRPLKKSDISQIIRQIEEDFVSLNQPPESFIQKFWPIIAKKRKANGLDVIDLMSSWKPFKKVCFQKIVSDPNNFHEHHVKVNLSQIKTLHILKNKQLNESDMEALLFVRKGYLFDQRNLLRQAGSSFTLNEINQDAADAEDGIIEFGLKDILAIAIKYYNPLTHTIKNFSLQKDLKIREERREAKAKALIKVFGEYILTRAMTTAFSESDRKKRLSIGVDAKVLMKSPEIYTGVTLTTDRWKAWIREAACWSVRRNKNASVKDFGVALVEPNAEDYEGLSEVALIFLKLLNHVIDNHKQTFIHQQAKSSIFKRLSFLITELRERQINASAPIFKGISEKHKTTLKRINRMVKSHKTRLQLEPFIRFDSYNPHEISFYEYLRVIKNTNINESTLRNFIVATHPTFSQDNLEVKTHDYYYRNQNVYLALANNIVACSIKPEFANQIFKLIVSEVNGGGLSAFRIEKIAHNIAEFKGASAGQFRSLSDMGFYINDRLAKNIEPTLEQLKPNGWLVDECDASRLLNMGINTQLLESIQSITVSAHGQKEISIPLDEISISIMPSNRFTGLIAAGVPGVCISVGGHHHLSQIRPECRNLVVYDNKKIYLWGLLVESESGEYFLNNLQGGFTAKLKKQRNKVMELIIESLKELGTVVLMDHKFNAINFSSYISKTENIKLRLPRLRLDTHQDEMGYIKGRFLVIPGG